MNLDTPLAEVCAHLPVEVARMLLKAAPETVDITLMAIRQLLYELEQNGSTLDPITQDIVLSNFALHVAGLHSLAILAMANTEE